MLFAQFDWLLSSGYILALFTSRHTVLLPTIVGDVIQIALKIF